MLGFLSFYFLVLIVLLLLCFLSHTELTRFGNEMMLCKTNDQDLIKVWSYTILVFILSSTFYIRSRIEITVKCF